MADAYSTYIANIGQTLQTTQATESQIQNNAGGYVFEVTDEMRLRRFLILGSERNTFYANAATRTDENSDVISKLIKAGKAEYIIDQIVDISTKGKARKNDQLIFALLRVFIEGNAWVKSIVTNAFPKVVRTGTHFFTAHKFLKLYTKVGVIGWGNKVKNLMRTFYHQDTKNLAFQMVKYRNRESWNWKDSLRLNHVKPFGDNEVLFKYIVKDVIPKEWPQSLKQIEGFEAAKTASVEELVSLIKEYKLQEEMVPTVLRKDIKIQEALLDTMGLTAIIRHLGSFSASGMLVEDNMSAIEKIEAKLADVELLRRAKIHPLFVLDALMTYKSGHGLKGSLRWVPVERIIYALNTCYYKTFELVEPTGKNIMLAIDVSGSMGYTKVSNVLSARDASMALAMIFLRTEKEYCVKGFSNSFIDLNVTNETSLVEAIEAVSNLPFASTDCSLPMMHAIENKLNIDAFVVITDNETYTGKIHPFEALKQYRRIMNKPDAKLVVVGVDSSNFTIADPNDAGMLDVCGFSTDCGTIISDFIKGEI